MMDEEEKTSSTREQAFIRADAAAAYLDTSVSWLAKLRCYGGGPRYSKIGRHVNYAIKDLDAWRDKHLVTSTSDTEAQRKPKKQQPAAA